MYLFTFSPRAGVFDVNLRSFVANNPRAVKSTIHLSVSFLNSTNLKQVQSRCTPSISPKMGC